jgi:hypothetical protein
MRGRKRWKSIRARYPPDGYCVNVLAIEVWQLRHLKDVEAELGRLEQMYVDPALEHYALKSVVPRNG